MTSHPTNTQTPPLAPVVREQSKVGFALFIQHLPAGELYFPANNLVGFLLLRQVLERALAERGILIETFIVGSELNDARGFAVVTDRQAGLETFMAVFKEFALLWVVQIAWYDTSEGIWRHFHSEGPRADFKVILSDEYLAAVQQRLAQRTAFFEQLRNKPLD
jgi:hypothetical protein